MSVPWWRGIPPAAARVSCDGREHQLRGAAGELLAPSHPDLEGEQILGALAGQRAACLDALDAWARHANDLRVLVMASRGAADPVRVRPQDAAYVAPSVTGRGPAVMARRRAAVTAMMIGGGLRERGDTLATLLSLGGPMQARLTATVAAAWRERLRDGAAPADAAPAPAARPALHAALYRPGGGGGAPARRGRARGRRSRAGGPPCAARGPVRPGRGPPARLDRAAGPEGHADHDRGSGPAGPGP